MMTHRTSALATALLSAVLLISSATVSSSQAVDLSNYKEPFYRNVVGFSVSGLTGYGLQYQYRFTPDFRLKAVGIYYEEVRTTQSEYLYNVALEAQHDFVRTVDPNISYRLYGLAAIRYYEAKDSFNNSGLSVNPGYDRSFFTNTAGIGIGLEAIISQRFVLTGEVNYSRRIDRSYSIFNDGNYTRTIVPFIGIAVGYMF
ncbi:MAG: outer membrane beta-barrel protein [Candidatus Kapabacteria bacterium]|nr:outer membrane beta-barrel protein [Candidatus Kapabacteria bacterium]